MVAFLAEWTPHLHHSFGDWCCMALIMVAFAIPPLVVKIRHELWRRRVLSAMK
jgi:hypothetical protein